MRMIFFNIAWMDYYKGRQDIDRPTGGGSYVQQNGFGSEIYNFKPEKLTLKGETEEDEYCFGFFETKSTKGQSNQLHIEKIRGCELLKNEGSAEDVLVVYCTTHPAHHFTTVVGWYNHATVFRNYQEQIFAATNGGDYYQAYNAIAKAKDCVLLPRRLRAKRLTWEVPRRKANGRSYGFGRANVWFAEDKDNPDQETWVKKMLGNIENYNDENWLYQYPEEG